MVALIKIVRAIKKAYELQIKSTVIYFILYKADFSIVVYHQHTLQLLIFLYASVRHINFHQDIYRFDSI